MANSLDALHDVESKQDYQARKKFEMDETKLIKEAQVGGNWLELKSILWLMGYMCIYHFRDEVRKKKRKTIFK